MAVHHLLEFAVFLNSHTDLIADDASERHISREAGAALFREASKEKIDNFERTIVWNLSALDDDSLNRIEGLARERFQTDRYRGFFDKAKLQIRGYIELSEDSYLSVVDRDDHMAKGSPRVLGPEGPIGCIRVTFRPLNESRAEKYGFDLKNTSIPIQWLLEKTHGEELEINRKRHTSVFKIHSFTKDLIQDLGTIAKKEPRILEPDAYVSPVSKETQWSVIERVRRQVFEPLEVREAGGIDDAVGLSVPPEEGGSGGGGEG